MKEREKGEFLSKKASEGKIGKRREKKKETRRPGIEPRKPSFLPGKTSEHETNFQPGKKKKSCPRLGKKKEKERRLLSSKEDIEAGKAQSSIIMPVLAEHKREKGRKCARKREKKAMTDRDEKKKTTSTS